MSNIILTGDTSGTLNIAAPLVAGTNTQTLVAATGTLAPIVSGTAVTSTSGTSIDFTSIPSWVKRITVMFSGVSTNGTSNLQIQLGTSGGVQTTGYLSDGFSTINNLVGNLNYTTGFGIGNGNQTAASLSHGSFTITNLNANVWTIFGAIAQSNSPCMNFTAGSKDLAATLDRVRITTVNGTDTFDAGTINILYE